MLERGLYSYDSSSVPLCRRYQSNSVRSREGKQCSAMELMELINWKTTAQKIHLYTNNKKQAHDPNVFTGLHNDNNLVQGIRKYSHFFGLMSPLKKQCNISKWVDPNPHQNTRTKDVWLALNTVELKGDHTLRFFSHYKPVEFNTTECFHSFSKQSAISGFFISRTILLFPHHA